MNCYSFIRLDINRIWPHAAMLRKPLYKYRHMFTHTSTDEESETSEALAQLISGIESDPVSNRETCTAYIEKMCRLGSVSEAARLMRSLHDRQIFFNPKTYNMVLTVVGEQKNFDILSQIFKKVLPSCDLGPAFYSNLAKVFSNSSDFVPLRKFLNEVSEMIFPNSNIIMNKMIIGFAESNQIDKALLVFDLMKDLNCKPDTITYNIVLNILGRAGSIDEMLHIFTSMKESGFTPDIITYSTLINNLRKFGRLDLCLVFFQEMIEEKVEPDLRTYTAVIDSFGRSGRVEEALGLLGQMRRKGLHPSMYIYRAMISNLKKVGKLKLAARLEEEMNSSISDFQSPRTF